MARFFFIALSVLTACACAGAAHAEPSPTSTAPAAQRQTPATGKSGEQVLQELIAARKAGEMWRGNAAPSAIDPLTPRRAPTDAPAPAQIAPASTQNASARAR
ncbi:DUF4148 domain-containing protein [Achromobacter xylosoxidans]|uniref:DUF4148 domain-containing protein n=1 Tax=Achromobacter TaxID=222 RepID=UPI000D6955B7|nr:DUF4148 domain-containing protein [Achromobacter xylosoxidans]QQV14274.1 DUF4148 domain-containing protein [Achromobacter xylosoxidans]